MQQPRTEANVEHTNGQQDTGNHGKPGTERAGGADRLGGTRAGAENVERVSPDEAESVETSVEMSGEDRTEVRGASGLGEVNASEKTLGDTGSVESAPEHEEGGRL